MTYRFIADHTDEQPVTWMCEALEVSASGYYAWAARADRPAGRRRQELVGGIEAVHADARHRYGSPRMHAESNARGHDCSENTVAKLMKAQGIRARARERTVRTTDSRHRLPAAGNTPARDFGPAGPSEAWCADVTFVGTREGWPDPAVVEDLFSRRVVGWSLGDSMASRPPETPSTSCPLFVGKINFAVSPPADTSPPVCNNVGNIVVNFMPPRGFALSYDVAQRLVTGRAGPPAHPQTNQKLVPGRGHQGDSDNPPIRASTSVRPGKSSVSELQQRRTARSPGDGRDAALLRRLTPRGRS